MSTPARTRLLDRLTDFDDDVAQVIRRVLYEEQRRLGLKTPRDIVNAVQDILEQTIADKSPEEHGPS